jgi:class 3 adenylate cyclase
MTGGGASGGNPFASLGLCSGKRFRFADRGEYVLRGFEDPVRVFEIGARE